MDYESGIRFPDHSKLAINLEIINNVIIQRQNIIVKVFLTLSHISYLLSIIISISVLVLELRQFLLTKDLTRQSDNECIHV